MHLIVSTSLSLPGNQFGRLTIKDYTYRFYRKPTRSRPNFMVHFQVLLNAIETLPFLRHPALFPTLIKHCSHLPPYYHLRLKTTTNHTFLRVAYVVDKKNSPSKCTAPWPNLYNTWFSGRYYWVTKFLFSIICIVYRAW